MDPPDSELERDVDECGSHDQQLICCNVSKHAERRLVSFDWQGILHGLRASEEWKKILSSRNRYDTTTRFTRLAILRSCEMANGLIILSQGSQHVDFDPL